jgi:nucleotide-binding universal stress UspA family protein
MDGLIKLLLAIDALNPSEEIVAAVVTRPWPPHTFARVVTAIEYAAKIWHDADWQIEPVKRAMLKRAKDVSGQAVEQIKQSGISAQPVIKSDDPRFVILSQAEDWPADLILIRAHTYTDFSRWLLGSVSGVVLRDAPCSVEIVRTSTASAEHGARNGLKILMGIDGSSFSFLATRSVAARPWPPGTIVRLLSVVEPVVHFTEYLTHDGKTEAVPMREVLVQAEAIISVAGLTTTSDIIKGDPKEEIINQAGAWGADLVVVGSHGKRGLKRWLLGSVSEAVARHAPCSVEVIRTSKGGR